MELNHMQTVASETFQKWYKKPTLRRRPWFEISGPAGSGKTTVVKHIIDALGMDYKDVIFMAYVGKAALALRLSGVNGRTIHSVVYDIVEHPKRDMYGNIMYNADGSPVFVTKFIKKDSLPSHIKLLVVDEGGMVAESIGKDILSFNIPTLVLGDLNQLPPVFGESMFLHEPDVILNEIMRQKKDSPIIYLSQLAIHGMPINYNTYGEDVKVIRKVDLTDEMLEESDLVLCATNNIRDEINWYMRENIFGITEPHVVVGEKLICRKNCWNTLLNDDSIDNDIALVNGMIGTVKLIDKNKSERSANMYIDFKPEFSNKCFKHIPINSNLVLSPYAQRNRVNPKYVPFVIFELGYCSTCHLAQGSQYDNILVFVDTTFSDSSYFRKWLYTAITRAKSKLTVVL